MADDEQRDDTDRDAILRRRHRLIAVALSGLVSGTAQACACLSYYEPGPDAGRDAGQDAGPSADASAPTDAGPPADASADDASVSVDGGPLPCLTPLPPDGGSDSGA